MFLISILRLFQNRQKRRNNIRNCNDTRRNGRDNPRNRHDNRRKRHENRRN